LSASRAALLPAKFAESNGSGVLFKWLADGFLNNGKRVLREI
jgi:hypothetical protein